MSSASSGKRDGVVRIVPYAARQVGALRSAWVYTPMGARGGEALAVVYALHGRGDGAAEWRAIDEVSEMLVSGPEWLALEPAIVVIPISVAAGATVLRPARSGASSDNRLRAAEVFTDLMPLLERSFNVSTRSEHRMVLVQAAPDGPDEFLAAVRGCNLSLPPESRFRVIAAAAQVGAGAPAPLSPMARLLMDFLRESAGRALPPFSRSRASRADSDSLQAVAEQVAARETSRRRIAP
jgi:hypothetical protein